MSLEPVIVIFGITGDLSKRKLLPALYHLIAHDFINEKVRIIGTSRREINKDDLLKSVELCVLEADSICDPVGLKKLRDSLEIIKLDPAQVNDYRALSEKLNKFDSEKQRQRMFYMALPPAAFSPMIEQLASNNLNDSRTRLMVEKPFGSDTKSAQKLIDTTNRYFSESQIYRIDHYLAKETAQNLLAFRLHNPIFSSLWNSEHIDTIHIKAMEKIGIENRIDFYEETGALRDLIQSHLMQLLAVIMMEQPADDTSESIHEGKQVFLRSLEAANPSNAVRAQYVDYKNEVGNAHSRTETYARVELASKSVRWIDTKIILETGKAMSEKLTEVVIQFKHPHVRLRNQLRFQIQPNEGISLDLVVKKPGFDDAMHHTKLDFSYKESFKSVTSPDAYERVIMDAIRGDQSLFTSSQELLYAWQVLEPVIEDWSKNDAGLLLYKRGEEPIQ